MSSAIQNTLHSAIGDGARTTKFRVNVVLPKIMGESQPADDLIAIVAKTASFPGKSLSVINVKHKGLSIPVKGDIKHTQTWDCTFYMSSDHSIKSYFELWVEAMSAHHTYGDSDSYNQLKSSKDVLKDVYMTNIYIFQEDFDGTRDTAKYTLSNCFPTQISPLTVSYEGASKVHEFTVSFSYTHYRSEIVVGGGGNFIDDIKSSIKNAVSNVITNGADAVAGFINGAFDSLPSIGSRSAENVSGSPTQATKVQQSLNNGGSSPDDQISTLTRGSR